MNNRAKIDELFDLCEQGDCRLLNFIAFKRFTHVKNIDNDSLFGVAIKFEHVALVKQMLQCNFMATHETKLSAFSACAKTGNCEIAELLCHMHSIDSDIRSEMLSIACKRGHTDLVKFLLPQCTELDLNDGLVNACSYGHADIVRLLIGAGATSHLDEDDNLLARMIDPWVSERQLSLTALQPILDVLVPAGAVINADCTYFWRHVLCRSTIPMLQHVLSLGHDRDTIQRALAGTCAWGRVDLVDYLFAFADDHDYEIDLLALIDDMMGRNLYSIATHLLARFDDGHIDTCVYGANKLLCYAVACGRVELVQRVLARGDCDVNWVVGRDVDWSTYQCTALSWATNTDIVTALLNAKADVNPKKCSSVMRRACEELCVDTVQLLLDSGADATVLLSGNGPLDYTLKAKCSDTQVDDKVRILQMLLSAGATTTRSVARRRTAVSALHYCATADEDTQPCACIRILVQHDPSLLEFKDHYGTTPLMAALSPELQSISVIQTLVSAGSDVHARDRFRAPILFLLFRPGSNESEGHSRRTREALSVLLAGGADPTACSGDGANTTVLMEMFSVDEDGQGLSDAALSIYIEDILDVVVLGRVNKKW
jgi:ankyrin repeat protein